MRLNAIQKLEGSIPSPGTVSLVTRWTVSEEWNNLDEFIYDDYVTAAHSLRCFLFSLFLSLPRFVIIILSPRPLRKRSLKYCKNVQTKWTSRNKSAHSKKLGWLPRSRCFRLFHLSNFFLGARRVFQSIPCLVPSAFLDSMTSFIIFSNSYGSTITTLTLPSSHSTALTSSATMSVARILIIVVAIAFLFKFFPLARNWIRARNIRSGVTRSYHVCWSTSRRRFRCQPCSALIHLQFFLSLCLRLCIFSFTFRLYCASVPNLVALCPLLILFYG